jgi:hypothetical protein
MGGGTRVMLVSPLLLIVHCSTDTRLSILSVIIQLSPWIPDHND